MAFDRLVITGGAGFVGSNLAIRLRAANPDRQVLAFDNLKRRGSELNLPRLAEAGVAFAHGDIRSPTDLDELPAFDLLIDCAAEPSVQAGLGGSPRGVLETNLVGTINCLEVTRTHGAAFLFLSSSRVFPIEPLNRLPCVATPTRFRWEGGAGVRGWSEHGIAEDFTLDGARSFYGASKLAGELLVQEYVHNSGMRALIDRCGVLTGPWQMGKVDQGVITLWVARHFFGRPLRYTGFGGTGKQVRDLLHIDDLADLIERQLAAPEVWDGRVYNVGGGEAASVSLRELTDLCVAATGHAVPITPEPATSAVDLRIFLTDARRAQTDFDWRPRRDPAQVVREIHDWIEANQAALRGLLT